MGIAPVVLTAGGYQKGMLVPGVFLKNFPRQMLVVTESSFFATQDVGVGLLPRAPAGQGREPREIPSICKMSEKKIGCRSARFTDCKAGVLLAVEDQNRSA